MTVFAIAVLLGLGTMVVAMAGRRITSWVLTTELWPALLLGVGIGIAWVLHFDVWQLWGVPVRGHWLGVTFTGVVLAGIAQFWYQLLGMLGGIMRVFNDRASALEKDQGLRRVA